MRTEAGLLRRVTTGSFHDGPRARVALVGTIVADKTWDQHEIDTGVTTKSRVEWRIADEDRWALTADKVKTIEDLAGRYDRKLLLRTVSSREVAVDVDELLMLLVDYNRDADPSH